MRKMSSSVSLKNRFTFFHYKRIKDNTCMSCSGSISFGLFTGWGPDEAPTELLEWDSDTGPGPSAGQGNLVRGGHSGMSI